MTFDELIEKNEEYVTDPYEAWDGSDKTAAWVEKGGVYPRPSSMVSGTNYNECLKRPLRSRSGPPALEV